MSTLIVTLAADPADAATLYDYVLSPDGQSVAEHSRAPLALLPRPGRTTEVVALVPARQLSWHQVRLPQGTLGRRWPREGGSARLRAVLEGLLEEHVLDDTAHLHFALAPAPREQAPVWVAVCERAWLSASLRTLEQAGLAVSRIVPEFSPGAPDPTLYVMGEPEQAQVLAHGDGAPVVWPLSPAAVALLEGPSDRSIVAEPAVAALAEQSFQRQVTLQQAAQRHLQALQTSWDLAQFDLLSSGRARSWRRGSAALAELARAPRWRAARLALLALLTINLVGLNAWAWKEKAALQARRSAIQEVLTRTFPQVRVVVDAPLQMAREVAALQQGSGSSSGRDLETLLTLFASAAPAHAAPQRLEFSDGELRLQGHGLTPDELNTLSSTVAVQGYAVRGEGDRLLIRPVSEP